jgi:aspartyl-tRNA synthetase
VDKFYSQEDLKLWAEKTGAKAGDLVLLLSGKASKVQSQMNELRLHMGNELGLRDPKVFAPLWVIDFPLLELDEETGQFHAMHHPFTSPKAEDFDKIHTDPAAVRANAYDLAMNGTELGGGSIRIHDKELQARMFEILGFSDEEAEAQFGFLMSAFEYGAPPHGGLAFGLDRLVSMMGGSETIRDYIAFPKNNSGRDVMIDAPAPLNEAQLEELHLKLNENV